MRTPLQSQSEFESLDSAQVNKLPPHLKKTKCTDEKAFRSRRKQEALELAELAYDLFKEETTSSIIEEGHNND